MWLKKGILCAGLLGLVAQSAYAERQPYCATAAYKKAPMIVAYVGSDTGWNLNDPEIKRQLQNSLRHVTVVNYAFARFGVQNGNTVLRLTREDLNNLHQLRLLRPDLPILLSIGGWGARDAFKPFLESKRKREAFAKSVFEVLQNHHLDGIDVDWENELLSSEDERKGLVDLFHLLAKDAKKPGYCVSNAVPATPAYWRDYPSAHDWAADVQWTTLMSYDHYGTFGPFTEHASALYTSERTERALPEYSYKTTSGHLATKHYVRQGLPVGKVLLGIPFYCHSYYVTEADIEAGDKKLPGLHVPALDPNISSQIDYQQAYRQLKYGSELWAHTEETRVAGFTAPASYGLRKLPDTEISQFLSCESPASILSKIMYVRGNNIFDKKLAGVSFWSLSQDLPYEHEDSLLKAIVNGFAQKMVPSPITAPVKKEEKDEEDYQDESQQDQYGGNKWDDPDNPND